MKKKIQMDIIELMKSGQKEELEITRYIFSLIQKEEKDKNIELKDSEVIQVLKKAIKRNQDSLTQYKLADRQDLASREEREIEIIKKYLPAELSESEVKEIIRKSIQETGAESIKDLGKVLGLVKKNHGDEIDMSVASKLVKESLS
tara:strand:+ start:1267 stop:1704 length:438 start_codon:yes stop_codon:yes gene_type:complete